MKIHRSKLGLKFAVSEVNKPAENDLVFFTKEELDWIVKRNLSPEEFQIVWGLKKEDHNYSPIPERIETKAPKNFIEECMEQVRKVLGS